MSGRSLLLMLWMAAATLVAPAVNAQEINVEFDETVDFSRFKTFTIGEGRIDSRAPALNSELTKKRLRDTLAQAFIKRGLTPAENQADLNVNFHFGSERTMENKTVPVGWRGRGTRVIKERQSEGTLVVDLYDAARRELVWRGVAVEAEPNPVKLAEKLTKIVEKTVGKYPKLKRK